MKRPKELVSPPLNKSIILNAWVRDTNYSLARNICGTRTVRSVEKLGMSEGELSSCF